MYCVVTRISRKIQNILEPGGFIIGLNVSVSQVYLYLYYLSAEQQKSTLR